MKRKPMTREDILARLQAARVDNSTVTVPTPTSVKCPLCGAKTDLNNRGPDGNPMGRHKKDGAYHVVTWTKKGVRVFTLKS